MQEIQIALNPSNWEKSRITAVGVKRDGKVLSSEVTTMLIDELPDAQAAVMQAILQDFLSIDPGGKEAVFAVARQQNRETTCGEDGMPLDEPIMTPYVEIALHWSYPDATTETEIFELTEQPAMDLVEYLLNEQTYNQDDEETN